MLTKKEKKEKTKTASKCFWKQKNCPWLRTKNACLINSEKDVETVTSKFIYVHNLKQSTLFPRSSNRSVSMFCPACPLVYYYLFSLTSSLFTVHISPFVSDESVSSFSTCYDIYMYIYIEVEQPPKLCMHEKRMSVSQQQKVISIMWNVTTNTNDKLKCSKRLHFKSQKADY